MNSLGQVTYVPFAPNHVGRLWVFLDETRIAAQGDVIDGQTLRNFQRGPAINDDGTVAFLASFSDFGVGIFTQVR